MIQTQFNASIEIVHSENGGKYMSSNLGTFFREHGIIYQTTYVGSKILFNFSTSISTDNSLNVHIYAIRVSIIIPYFVLILAFYN
jgi:hypothetical protein